jgi:hypothetical protein
MPTSSDILNLIKTVGPSLGIDQNRYWQWGDTPVPRDAYHQVVILVMGDYSPAVLAAIPATFELKAKDAGYRLLKVVPTGEPIGFGSYTARLYTGYAASDVWEKPVSDLSDALVGAPVVIDSQPVGLAEKAALDALWVSKGAKLPEVEHVMKLNLGLAAGLAAILGVTLLMWATVRAK